MTIFLKKFGTTLIGRQMGKEALAAFSPTLKDVGENEKIEIDFDDVVTFTPSWGDEFLSPLLDKYGEKLTLKQTKNPSVLASVKMLDRVNEKKFKWDGSN